MYNLEINEEIENLQEAIRVLEEIINQLRAGNTSGVNPSWSIGKD